MNVAGSAVLEFYSKADFIREVRERRASEEPYRSEFRKDYARLIHAPAFRRLQRKTQLFPGDESDFFRNRITHSLEVAQIAKSIALRLNYLMQQKGYNTAGIDTDLVEFAGLAHDIGHPPFGHTGEYALDSKMKNYGGFEGNAQTLRILTRTEKKRTKHPSQPFDDFVEYSGGIDLRAGLNLSFRTLASIVKYDNKIPEHRNANDRLAKGFYGSEAPLVAEIKGKLLGKSDASLETVEMQIMDLADDIAYSTYDLEDAMKGGFTSPIDLLAQVNNNEELRDAVAEKLFKSKFKRIYSNGNASPEDERQFSSIKTQIEIAIATMFSEFFGSVSDYVLDKISEIETEGKAKGYDADKLASLFSLTTQKFSSLVQGSGYNRIAFTSDLIGKRIRSVDIEVNEKNPMLSIVRISDEERFSMDILKHLTYELQIRSPRLKVLESRGTQIVCDLFDHLSKDPDGELLPADWRARIRGTKEDPNSEAARMRLVCDYIAGMTDHYALDVYARFTSSHPSNIFKPL